MQYITMQLPKNRLLHINSSLDNAIPNTLAILHYRLPVRIPVIKHPILPIRPIQPPESGPQHGQDPPGYEIHTHRAVGVAVERLPGIIGVALEPDMVEGDDLRVLCVGAAGEDPVTGDGDDAFDGDMGGVCGGASKYKCTHVSADRNQ